jgi:hypothetical protein
LYSSKYAGQKPGAARIAVRNNASEFAGSISANR